MPLFGLGKSDSGGAAGRGGRSSYAYRLAHIGRQIDDAGSRSTSIIEVSGSFIVRSTDTNSNQLILHEVVDEDFQRGFSGSRSLLQSARYEPRLGEIGLFLDEQVAANVAIIECNDAFQVIGWRHGEAAGRATYVRFDRHFTFDQLNELSGRRG